MAIKGQVFGRFLEDVPQESIYSLLVDLNNLSVPVLISKIWRMMKFVPTRDDIAINFKSASLIVSSTTIGNVGQLAVDLLIETLRPARVGFLADDAFLPAVGMIAYSHVPDIAMSLEVYYLEIHNTFIVQQRAPAAPGLEEVAGCAMALWIQLVGISSVCILASFDARERHADQLEGPQIRFWSVDVGHRQRGMECGLRHLEDSFFAEKSLDKRVLPPWPLVKALKDKDIDACVLAMFSSEGDNLGDALALAAAINRLSALGLPDTVETWKTPTSWKYVYGEITSPVY